ncbi:MAG TPA: TIR domain-containing protein, partial [Fimbriimonadaceae bacterium]|nr:TIR domain-containing protein [Fimbriimonadaceae bacterium]
MPNEFRYDVFLSHNSADKDPVRRLAERLKQAGLRVWFDEWNVKPGDIIPLAVDDGLDQSRVLLLCISPNALASGWVALERSTAIHRDPANASRRFVPLLLADCDLPDTLRRYKYVDYRGEAEVAFSEVLTACRPDGEEIPSAAESAPKETARPNGLGKEETLEHAQPAAILDHSIAAHKNWVSSVAVSPDAKWAASGSHDKGVKIWNLETGELQATCTGHQQEVQSVLFDVNRGQLISASNDSSIRVWDPLTGRQEASLQGHVTFVRSISVSSPADRLLSGQDVLESSVWLKLWDLRSRSAIQSIFCGENNGDGIFSTAIDATGRLGLTGHRGGDIRIWDLESGLSLATLQGHAHIVDSIQISPDNRLAVSGSHDKTLKVWDLETRACVGTLEGHRETVYSVAISTDGALVASGSFDGTIRLWNLETGTCLQVIGIAGERRGIGS